LITDEYLYDGAGGACRLKVIDNRVGQYMAALLILSGMMNGVFCAMGRRAVLRFFSRATLIPDVPRDRGMGRPESRLRRVEIFSVHAARSLLTLVALIYLYTGSGGSFSLPDYYQLQNPIGHADPFVHSIFCGLRRQGADVPGAYVCCRTAHVERRPGAPSCWPRSC